MAIKKSVRLVDETIQLCHELSDAAGEVNWSGSINAMAEQYKIFAVGCMPSLTENQWNAFYCLYNGYMPHPSIQEEAKLLPWHVSEGYQYDSQVREFLGEKDHALQFLEQIKNWSTAQRVAVIYKAKAFWRKGPVSDDPHEDVGTENTK